MSKNRTNLYLLFILIIFLGIWDMFFADFGLNRLPYCAITALGGLFIKNISQENKRSFNQISKSTRGCGIMVVALISYYTSGIHLVYILTGIISLLLLLVIPDKRWIYSLICLVCVSLGWSMIQSDIYKANWLAMFLFCLILLSIIIQYLSRFSAISKISDYFNSLSFQQTDQKQDNYALILTLLIIGIVLLPLLLPTTYIFALDHVRNPFGFFTNDLGSRQLVPRVYNFLIGFMPGRLAEKIIIITSFVGGVFGMYRLLSKKTISGGVDNIFSLVFAVMGLFFNPFFYGRFVDGQSNVYMSLLLLPYVVYVTINIFQNLKIDSLLYFVLTLLVFGGLSTHNLIFLAIFLLISAAIFGKIGLSEIKKTIIIGFLSLVAVAPRIFVTLYGGAQTDKMISNFDQTHLSVFQPQPLPGYPFYVTMTTLQGYWGESMNRFQPSFLTNSQRGGVWILTIVLMLFGCIFVFQSNNKILKKTYFLLFIMALFGFMLGGGTTWGGWVGSITQWLYENVTIYRGLREPHKRMMWVVLFYNISGALGVKFLYEVGKKYIEEKRIIYSCALVLILLPIISTPALLFGAQGQIKLGTYPSEWYDLRNKLQSKQGIMNCGAVIEKKQQYCRNILVLPRHGYLSFPFTQGRVIANPIYSFMGNTGLMVSDTVEIASLYSQTTKRENILYQNEIYPQLSGLLFESDLDHTRGFDFVNDAIIRKVAHKFNEIGISEVIVFKTSSDRKTDVDRLSFLVLHGYASIEESNDQYIRYKLHLEDRLIRN